MKECSCEGKFRDGEDFRDHLPCDGPEAAVHERKLIVSWLHTMQITPHKEPADYASLIERKEHYKSAAETFDKYREKKTT